MKQILLFPLLLLFTVVSAASQIVIDGRPAVCDSATGMMLLSVPDSVFGQPYSAPVIAMQDVTGLMINGQQITDHVDLPLVDGTTSYPVEYLYNGKTVSLKASQYQHGGTLAVVMETEDGESYVITTNLRSPFQSDSMAFLDTNNYPKIESFIQKNNLGLPMGVNETSGFCTYPLYTIFTNSL